MRFHEMPLRPEEVEAVLLAGGEPEGVELNVNYVVENCKLPEKPDEQLHLVLEHMFEGIEQMKAPDGGRNGAIAIVEALNAYGEHFDHPAWQPLAL